MTEFNPGMWYDIASAPKNGTTVILGAIDSTIVYPGEWDLKYKGWFSSCGRALYPSHWMPLPYPPESEV